MAKKNNRAHLRLRIESSQAVLHTESIQELPCQLVDLSEGGCRCHFSLDGLSDEDSQRWQQILGNDVNVTIEFRMAEHLPHFKCAASIRNSKLVEGDHLDLGMRFESVSAEQSNVLRLAILSCASEKVRKATHGGRALPENVSRSSASMTGSGTNLTGSGTNLPTVNTGGIPRSPSSPSFAALGASTPGNAPELPQLPGNTATPDRTHSGTLTAYGRTRIIPSNTAVNATPPRPPSNPVLPQAGQTSANIPRPPSQANLPATPFSGRPSAAGLSALPRETPPLGNASEVGSRGGQLGSFSPAGGTGVGRPFGGTATNIAHPDNVRRTNSKGTLTHVSKQSILAADPSRRDEVNQFHGKEIGEILANLGLVKIGDLATARQQAHQAGEMLDTLLLRASRITPPDLLRAWSLQSGLPAVDLNQFNPSDTVARCLPFPMMERYQCVPFLRRPGMVCVAAVRPLPVRVVEDFALLTGCPVEHYLAQADQIAQRLNNQQTGSTQAQRPASSPLLPPLAAYATAGSNSSGPLNTVPPAAPPAASSATKPSPSNSSLPVPAGGMPVVYTRVCAARFHFCDQAGQQLGGELIQGWLLDYQDQMMRLEGPAQFAPLPQDKAGRVYMQLHFSTAPHPDAQAFCGVQDITPRGNQWMYELSVIRMSAEDRMTLDALKAKILDARDTRRLSREWR